MAHTSMYPGNREIVEIEEEELNPGEGYRSYNYTKPASRREENDRRSLASNAGHVNTLEDDLNQLFEIFNRRASHGSSQPNQAGTSKRNASKKPVKAGVSHSPGCGISERMNLKQALRGLCLSQASEMAAIKHSMKSPRSSEAGRILTMYRNVVVEDSISDHSQDDDRAGMLEFSLVPEETAFDSFQNIPEKLPASDLWPSNRSSLAGRAVGPATMQNDRGYESKGSGRLILKPEKPAHPSSSSFPYVDDSIFDVEHNNLTHNMAVLTSTETDDRASASEMMYKQKHILPPPSSSPTARNSLQEIAKRSVRENGKPSISVDFASQPSTEASKAAKHASLTSSSCSSYAKNAGHARKLPAKKKELAATAADMSIKEKLEANKLHPEEHPLYSADFHDTAWEPSKSGTAENGKCPSSYPFLSQSPLSESLQNEKPVPLHSSRASSGKNSLDITRKMAEYKDIVPMSPVVRNQKKVDMTQMEETSHIRSPRCSNLGDKALHHITSSPSPSKSVKSKEAAAISIQVEPKELDRVVAGTLAATSTGPAKGKKVNKSTRNAHHFVRPLIKTKNFVKRKSKKKMAPGNSSENVRSEFNNDLYSSPHPIVCPRCQCVVADAWKEANKDSSLSHHDSPVSPQESPVSQQESPEFYQDSPISPFASLSGEVSSGNVFSEVSTPGLSSDGLDKSKTVLVESSGNSKSRDKAEFTQSSKGSRGECSSSTSGSEESNLSRPSFCDRPHMSKDARWEAVRYVRFQHGTLGLRHFNLLRKLGCGDIGTVYLAELIGTNCLFAIKVMDNEFLARRKKISRAQTEKEILRMLDHPFLPTLYCQFTSDNLSCLVMEYCPGGDLHVLRQRQPGRCFTEQAARFYVAEVLLALEYLHMLGVVYRDLKPENILVREDGHIMLSDFDLSLRCAVNPTLLVSSSMSESTRKASRESRPSADTRCAQPFCIEPSCKVSCFTPRLRTTSSKMRKMKSDLAAEMRPLLQLVAEPTSARSNSFVGTHEYLAPEIIKGDGHGSAVDWWTFGIFLYELLYGRTPFKGVGNEETLANVVLQSLKFPDSPLVSLQARDLISALLVKEPESRLGTERGAAEIKQHRFFDGLNWALIRCAVPPELPESQSFGMSKAVSLEKNKYVDHGSGSGSAEHLEFEVF